MLWTWRSMLLKQLTKLTNRWRPSYLEMWHFRSNTDDTSVSSVTPNTLIVEVTVAKTIDNCEVSILFKTRIKIHCRYFSFWWEQRLAIKGTQVHLKNMYWRSWKCQVTPNRPSAVEVNTQLNSKWPFFPEKFTLRNGSTSHAYLRRKICNTVM